MAPKETAETKVERKKSTYILLSPVLKNSRDYKVHALP
jgi:hypothetical protein